MSKYRDKMSSLKCTINHMKSEFEQFHSSNKEMSSTGRWNNEIKQCDKENDPNHEQQVWSVNNQSRNSSNYWDEIVFNVFTPNMHMRTDDNANLHNYLHENVLNESKLYENYQNVKSANTQKFGSNLKEK